MRWLVLIYEYVPAKKRKLIQPSNQANLCASEVTGIQAGGGWKGLAHCPAVWVSVVSLAEPKG